jgi:poly-gamma-glutamate synthase PgsB/CapB
MIMLVLCYLILGGLVASLIISKHRFDKQRDAIPYRIHVNGIRGKSTVTRYTAAILRDSGLRTFGKTTGTAARVILPNGQDAVISRRGYPNVNEQLKLIRSFASRQAEAVVMECMAINPDYQDWLENKVMHSQIVIITNVRLDHQEEMGKGLTDIARSLARSIPTNAILITAERRADVLAILSEVCKSKGTKLIQAPTHRVTSRDLLRFDHFAHKENVAIGLAVAKLMKIPAAKALASMVAAPSDPGAFQIQTFEQQGKQVKWANLFAVNDKESFAEIAEGLAKKYTGYYRVALLNNRHDRPSRVEMFSELAQDSLQADAIVALGDYEERVKKSVEKSAAKISKVSKPKVALFGNASRMAQSSGIELTNKIMSLADKPKVLMVGTVNIHTQQSENILKHIAKVTKTDGSKVVLPVYNPSQRLRSGFTRVLRKIDAANSPKLNEDHARSS